MIPIWPLIIAVMILAAIKGLIEGLGTRPKDTQLARALREDYRRRGL